MTWKTVRHGKLRLQIPEAAMQGDDQGVDSKAAIWKVGGMTVVIDEGPFSDPLTGYGDRPGFQEWWVERPVRPFRCVTFENPDGTKAVAVRVEGSSGAGAGERPSQPTTVVIHLDQGHDLDDALRVVDSITINEISYDS